MECDSSGATTRDWRRGDKAANCGRNFGKVANSFSASPCAPVSDVCVSVLDWKVLSPHLP